MVTADPRVVPVSADPISLCSAIELQSYCRGCMHGARATIKLAEACQGAFSSFTVTDPGQIGLLSRNP